MSNFVGTKYSDCNNWGDFIKNNNTDIKYLEIGVFYGYNFISVLNKYCANENSELHAIDCWADEHYKHYDYLTNKSELIYNTFLENLSICAGNEKKCKIHRGYSYEKIPLLPDNYFDIIYIDGCHEP